MANYKGYLNDKDGNKLYPYNKIRIYSSSSTDITFTAPFNCICDITYILNGWSYAGAEWIFKINCTNGGATELISLQGHSVGNDLVARNISCKSIFQLVEGVSYTFARSSITGALGGTKSQGFTVICFPID